VNYYGVTLIVGIKKWFSTKVDNVQFEDVILKFLNSSNADIGTINSRIIQAPELQVGIVGTFDVENYGDLLFPLIAQMQLEKRNENIKILSFSPNAVSKNQPWPMEVYSVEAIANTLPLLSALLIGGGQIVRFDKGYPIPVSSTINLPVDYWLSPAAVGALLGKPVIWNAVGAWTGSSVPPWYIEVLKATISASALVAVRDEASHAHLSQVNPIAEIQNVPDTAFSLARLWPNKEFSEQYLAWTKALEIDGPYIVVQADNSITGHLDAIIKLVQDLEVKTVVILPICRCHGDSSDNFPSLPFANIAKSLWLNPALTCEVISHASLLIASSLHACITSICYGIPCVRIESFNAYDRKFEILDGFENICRLDESHRIRSLFARGKVIDPKATEYADLLEAYWNEVARIITEWSASEAAYAMSVMLPWAMNVFKYIEVPEVQTPEPKKEVRRWNPFS
jgi:lipopolysaccharide transport system ATP-binding protein